MSRNRTPRTVNRGSSACLSVAWLAALLILFMSVVSTALASDWTQDAHDAQRTGYTADDPATPWTFLWAFNGPNSTPGTTDQHIYNAPREARVITGGSYVFVPAGVNGIYALNKSNGTQAWRFTSATVNATPAYDASTGMLYAGGANGTLYKIDTASNGSVAGTYNAGNAINKAVLLAGSYVYIVTDSGNLIKVDKGSMSASWTYSGGSTAATPPAYSAAKDVIVYCTNDLYVHAVTSAGVRKWRVKPSPNAANENNEFKFGWPVIADQHTVVLVRMHLDANSLWSGTLPGSKYPTTNAGIRQLLTGSPQYQNLFALDLDSGSVRFVPAVGPGSVEDYVNNGPFPRVGTLPVVKVVGGQEVAYQIWRNGDVDDANWDGRWDSHMGEMVLDGTTISGYAAGDLRFVNFTGARITDEQCPITMANNTLFHAHWDYNYVATLTNRADSYGGTRTNPIQATIGNFLCRALNGSGTPDTATHWYTGGLSHVDGRYEAGPGWWAYWKITDPPGSPSSSAYSAGWLPRYTIVADGLVIIEGNGGDLVVLRHSGGSGGTAPAAPSNLTATAASSSQINLSWTDNASNETGFKVERKTGSGGTWSQIATPGANVTSYQDTGLSASTTYYYRVRATNSYGDSAYSNEANATTSSGGGSNLLSNGGFDTGNLTGWTTTGTFTAVTTTPQAGSYCARHAGTVGSDSTLYQGNLALTGGVTYTLTAYYRVDTASVNAEGWRYAEIGFYPSGGPGWGNHLAYATIDDNTTTSGWVQVSVQYTPASNTTVSVGFANWQTDAVFRLDSFVLSNGSGGTAPAAPSSLSATAASSSQINLSWTDNASNETGFKIERKTGSGGTYAEITTVGANVTSYQNTGLAASTTYYYRVRATNGSGDSAYSNEANATTQSGGSAPAAPSNLSATATSSSQINLTWTDNASNETGFKLERKTGSGGTYAQIATPGANATSYNDTGLASGTTYYYRIRATNSYGDSAYSNEANATTLSGSAYALSYNGSSAYAAVNDAAVLDISGSAITMEAWVKVNSLPASGTSATIMARELGSSSGYALLVTSSGAVEARLGTSGNSWGDVISSNQTWASGTWYHVAASYDGTTVRVFRNGTQIGSGSLSGTLLAGSNKLYFGGKRYDWSSYDYLNGAIDEVRLSKVCRYTSNFTVPTAAFSNDGDTVGLWHFSENTGSTSADSSSNGLTATVSGATWTVGKF